MRTRRARWFRRTACAAALGALCAASGRAEETAPPPTVQDVEKDEKAGDVEAALGGWTTRALAATTSADRIDALRRYVKLAATRPAEADPWLVDSVQRSGAGPRVVAGRRFVAVMDVECLGGADAAKFAALVDAMEISAERMAGARPPAWQPQPNDKRPHDRAGRYLMFVGQLPSPVGDHVCDARLAPPPETERGLPFALELGARCAAASIGVAPNRRASRLEPAIGRVVRDLAAREVGEPALVAAVDKWRTRAKERYEAEWAAGCLPGESIAPDEPLAHLLFTALDAERGAKRDPADAVRAYLVEPRKDNGWAARVALPREQALEPLSVTFCAGFLEVFRRAGALPAGRALDDLRTRVAVEDQCREASGLWGDARPTAAGIYRTAAGSLDGRIAADDLLVAALEIERDTDAKRARTACKKLGLVEGFDFIGPMIESRPNGGVVVGAFADLTPSARLLPFMVATAHGRHPMKMKEPIDVSLKWEEVKDHDELVPRTPDWNKRGTGWGSTSVAAVKWTKSLGGLVRLRPCRSDWTEVAVLADGKVCDPWPDGSVLAPGAKGTEIVLASSSQITCALPWRDAASVEDDLAAAAAEPDAVLALRPWAARRVALALPTIVAALRKLPDAQIVRDMLLLAPYRGGDAATFDAMVAHAKGKPAVLAAYLGVCRGARDPAVVDRVVALGTAADATPETTAAAQRVVESALFRKVVEKGAELTALWERGRKWLGTVAVVEAEEVRDLRDHDSTCFRAVADPDAYGRACLAPAGGRRGEGYVALDIPDGSGEAWIAVRWRSDDGARLELRGYFTEGKKMRPYSVSVPAAPGEKPEWWTDVVSLGTVPRGNVVMAIDDPCATGCRIDAFAVGAKPLE